MSAGYIAVDVTMGNGSIFLPLMAQNVSLNRPHRIRKHALNGQLLAETNLTTLSCERSIKVLNAAHLQFSDEPRSICYISALARIVIGTTASISDNSAQFLLLDGDLSNVGNVTISSQLALGAEISGLANYDGDKMLISDGDNQFVYLVKLQLVTGSQNAEGILLKTYGPFTNSPGKVMVANSLCVLTFTNADIIQMFDINQANSTGNSVQLGFQTTALFYNGQMLLSGNADNGSTFVSVTENGTLQHWFSLKSTQLNLEAACYADGNYVFAFRQSQVHVYQQP